MLLDGKTTWIKAVVVEEICNFLVNDFFI